MVFGSGSKGPAATLLGSQPPPTTAVFSKGFLGVQASSFLMAFAHSKQPDTLMVHQPLKVHIYEAHLRPFDPTTRQRKENGKKNSLKMVHHGFVEKQTPPNNMFCSWFPDVP